MTQDGSGWIPHSAHWGAFSARWDGKTLEVKPYDADPAPSPILDNFRDTLRHRARVLRPMVRRSWLDGNRHARNFDDNAFVALPWNEVLDLLADELSRVRDNHGAASIYGGSYGWASAGRFHHAQSQIHRFLNTALGGYVRSVNSYSAGASAVILPHVMGSFEGISRHNVTWDQIAEHSDLVLAFGGMAVKNADVASGGVSRHIERDGMARAAARGASFTCISPLRDDLPEQAAANWLPLKVGTDVALMLGLAHTLVVENLHDAEFIARYTTGFERFARYLLGRDDGIAKDAQWACAVTGVPAETILALARRMPRGRTLVTVSHSLQRAEHGEQPVWMGAVLAAMIGQIGLPGGGYHYALGSLGHTGRRPNAVPIPTFSQGRNGVSDFIPVARVADMLLNPGHPFDYNGETRRYPDIRLVYWAGGNPFHHHQDINRLKRAFQAPDTIVVHESAWTPMARFADIVLPATMTLERDDIGAAGTDPRLVAMRKVAEPIGEARDDYAIFAELAQRMGAGEPFTEGRDVKQWLAHLYEPTRKALHAAGWDAPSFDEFWARGELALPSADDDGGFLRAFRGDPDTHKLATPSGRIEIFSETIAGFGYDDCPGHPAFMPSTEPPSARHPLTLIANQPSTRLHSQLDFGHHSQASKVRGREPVRLNPGDAQARGIGDGDIVRLFNDRGACLAGARLSDRVMPGIVQLSTGAWYDPDPAGGDQPICMHGNPNLLTRDIGTSKLAQGCCGQVTVVECERYDGDLPKVRAFDPPHQG
jgi:biotin/methionine sulfoxide reductase